MKILMTGVKWKHQGMIGSALSEYMEDKGYDIVRFEGDIRDSTSWQKYNNIKFDFLIHLAAKPGVKESLSEPDYYWDTNVNGTTEAFKFAESNGCKVLYASSSNAHEWWLNPYAMTKRVCEETSKYFDVASIGMRFHTVWPGRDDMLFKRIAAGDISYINEDHTRDFIHIEDLCSAICTIVEKYDIIDCSVVDIGTGDDVKVIDVFDKYWKHNTYPTRVIDSAKNERTKTKADVLWLKKLGWKPQRKII
jgi:nucleoside-diphosphate-sugar epimerase